MLFSFSGLSWIWLSLSDSPSLTAHFRHFFFCCLFHEVSPDLIKGFVSVRYSIFYLFRQFCIRFFKPFRLKNRIPTKCPWSSRFNNYSISFSCEKFNFISFFPTEVCKLAEGIGGFIFVAMKQSIQA